MRGRGDLGRFIAQTKPQMRRVFTQIESVRRLDIRCPSLFADRSISGEFGQARAGRNGRGTDADAAVEQLDQSGGVDFEVAWNDPRAVRPFRTLQIARQVGDRVEAVRGVRCRKRAAPGVVLDHAKGRMHLVVGIGDPEVEAVDERSVKIEAPLERDFVDFVTEVGVAEGVASRPDIRRRQSNTWGQSRRNDRDLVRKIDFLGDDAKDCAADRNAAAVRRGRLAFSGRMVAVEL